MVLLVLVNMMMVDDHDDDVVMMVLGDQRQCNFMVLLWCLCDTK